MRAWDRRVRDKAESLASAVHGLLLECYADVNRRIWTEEKKQELSKRKASLKDRAKELDVDWSDVVERAIDKFGRREYEKLKSQRLI